MLQERLGRLRRPLSDRARDTRTFPDWSAVQVVLHPPHPSSLIKLPHEFPFLWSLFQQVADLHPKRPCDPLERAHGRVVAANLQSGEIPAADVGRRGQLFLTEAPLLARGLDAFAKSLHEVYVTYR